MRVLVVVIDGALCPALALAFRKSSCIVDQSGSVAGALELAGNQAYDAVLADAGRPGMDDGELVRRLRDAQVHTPFLLLLDQGRPSARIKAFNGGADDVTTKPCDPDELVARLWAVVRRNRGQRQPTLQCGPLRLNQFSREALVSGQAVRLTGQEYAILELLVMRKGMALTKEVFLNHLYGGKDEPDAKIIDVFICKLRRKLAEAGAPHVIGTVWGRGYIVQEAGSHMHPMLPPSPQLMAVLTA